MLEFLRKLVASNGFIPHGHCYLWKPGLVWLHVASDLFIGLSYLAISVTLIYLIRRIRLPFRGMFLAFGLFIAACGATHFMEVITLWNPLYWISGGVKTITALASVTTATLLPPLVPQIVGLVRDAELAEDRRVQLETTNQELATLYQRVSQLDHLKTQFFANVSHELRTPLTLLLGPIERLLSTEQLTTTQRQSLEMVDRNAHILLKYVNDLLDVAKLDAEKMGIHYSKADLVALLGQLATYFDDVAQDQNIDLVLEFPEALPIQVDVEKIQRSFLNVLSNAFKFTPTGGRVCCRVLPMGDRVLIEVEDNGPGVPAALKEVIFERFRQGETETSQKFRGTGLGLAIAKSFVELHQGTITVEDADQGGALFRIDLPLKAAETATVQSDQSGTKQSSTDQFSTDQSGTEQSGTEQSGTVTANPATSALVEPNGRDQSTEEKAIARQVLASWQIGTSTITSSNSSATDPIDASEKRSAADVTAAPAPALSPSSSPMAEAEDSRPLVLVVEDNGDMSRFISTTLSDHYRIVTASNGQEGIDQAIAYQPDLILSDIMMPQLDGEQLIQAIRSIPDLNTIPIIVITARADDQMRVRLLRNGAQDYVMKPFVAEELRVRVDNQIITKQLLDLLQNQVTSQQQDVAMLSDQVIQRKQALQDALIALRRSEARFRRVVESNIIGIVFWKADGTILSANETFWKTIGYDLERLPQQPLNWRELTPPEWSEADEQAMTEIATWGASRPFEKEYFRQDGDRVPVLVGAATFEASDSEGVAFVLDISERKRAELALQAAYDQLEQRVAQRTLELSHTNTQLQKEITERQQAEAALVQEREFLKVLLENINAGIVACDAEGRITLFNQAAREFHGLAPEPLPPDQWATRYSLYRADGKTLLPTEEIPLYRALRGERVHNQEIRIVPTQEKGRTLLTSGQAILDPQGHKLGAVAVMHDITERKQAENLLRQSESTLRSFYDSASMMMGVLELIEEQDIHYVSANPATGQFLEMPPSEIANQCASNLAVMSPYLKNWIQHCREAEQTRAPVRFEYSHHRDQQDQWLSATVCFIHTEQSDRPQFAYVVEDISDRKRTEAQIRALNAELEQRVVERTAQLEAANRAKDELLKREQAARAEAESANRMKDEFLATLSHELRTPLNAILGWAQLLRTREFDPGTISRALETIERNARSQSQLVGDILDVSRIVRGDVRLNIAAIQLPPVIESALDTVRPAAEAKGIQIQCDRDAEIGSIMGDPDRLQQVVWNLLSNAIKFTPRGGQVTVQVHQSETALRLIISDTGQGISPEFLPHVFNRFSQADSSINRAFGGLGLGLAIVRHLVELHGGTVTANSDGAGKGATFTVSLPRLNADL